MCLSPIQEFYKNKTVFLTGATGFLGQSVLEKLLRTCREIKRVYVFVRPKKTLNCKERLEKLISDKLFDRVKMENPNFINKITIMTGDLFEEKLGLSEEDINTFINEINIVIHSAATIRFDEKLEIAVKLNICSGKYLLDLSKQCLHFESYVHISTAYSNSHLSNIEEKFYDPTVDPYELIEYAGKTNSEQLQKETDKIIYPHPNTYTFTKSLAEHTIKSEGKGLPVCIIRPSIVFGAFNEPYPGWAGKNISGPFGIMLGCGAGLIRVLKQVESNVVDYIPVDMVANAILAAGYDTAQKTKHDEVNIYNLVSQNSNPITWKESNTLLFNFYRINPIVNSLWTPSIYCTNNTYGYNILKLLLHVIPAYILDFFSIIMGKKPQFRKLYQKIHNGVNALRLFLVKEWNFSDKNTRKLYFSLTEKDRNLFNFDIKQVKWDIYCLNNVKQIRTELLNEPLTTIPAGRKQAKCSDKTVNYRNCINGYNDVKLYVTAALAIQEQYNDKARVNASLSIRRPMFHPYLNSRSLINLTIMVLFIYFLPNIYALISVMAVIIFFNLYNF